MSKRKRIKRLERDLKDLRKSYREHLDNFELMIGLAEKQTELWMKHVGKEMDPN